MWWLVLGLSALVLLEAQQTNSNYVTVNCSQGAVQGRTVDLGSDRSQLYSGQANAFTGIPYCQAPVGNLRLQPPQPLNTFNTTLHDATYFRPKCPQLNAGAPTNEDCLYLNIYTPQAGNRAANLSVLVMIDGSNGFSNGGCDQSQEKGIVSNLVQRQIVVVTLQYRIGALGFFTTYTNTVQSNLGMLDQVQAMRWIKSEIVNFGGNPNQITVAGQDDGACAVSAHTLSPMSQNLFNQAIVQSGSIYSCYNPTPAVPTNPTVEVTTPRPMYDQPSSGYGNANAQSGFYSTTTPASDYNSANAQYDDPNQQLAATLCNVSSDQWNDGQTQNLQNCLRNYTVDFFVNRLSNGATATWMIVRDTSFLPGSIDSLSGKRPNIPIIIGTVQDEDADYAFKLINTGKGSDPNNLDDWIFDFAKKNKLNQTQTNQVSNIISNNYGVSTNTNNNNGGRQYDQGSTTNQQTYNGQQYSNGQQNQQTSNVQYTNQNSNGQQYSQGSTSQGSVQYSNQNSNQQTSSTYSQGTLQYTQGVVYSNNQQYSQGSSSNQQNFNSQGSNQYSNTVQYTQGTAQNNNQYSNNNQQYNQGSSQTGSNQQNVNSQGSNQYSNNVQYTQGTVQNNNQQNTNSQYNQGTVQNNNQYSNNNQQYNQGSSQNFNNQQYQGSSSNQQNVNSQYSNNVQNNQQFNQGSSQNSNQQNSNSQYTQGTVQNNQQYSQGTSQNINNQQYQGSSSSSNNQYSGGVMRDQPVQNSNGVTDFSQLKTITQIASDQSTSLTTTQIQSFMQNGDRHVRIYQFTHVSEVGRNTVPDTGSNWKPVFKGQDMYFITMSETIWTNSNYTAQDRQVADQMGQRWSDFVKTGQVSGWDATNQQNYNYCNLNTNPSQHSQYGQQARQVFQDQVNPICQTAQNTYAAANNQSIPYPTSSSSTTSSTSSYSSSSSQQVSRTPGTGQAQYTSNSDGSSNFHLTFQVSGLPFNG